ncbi:Restriction endonuclease [Paraliobacillus sp. PM-2]|uniref:restriction endonuclease n=1 Tax=Paraliobacillus sp. PM-2 TaxID=1462524 RepID=UPI00061BC8C3|nr:restriction endonuclease [Paraliobacillus sp. PM-2]CQR46589.1 Restriction endonuclease [Paraliobacillus sp. PM-2]
MIFFQIGTALVLIIAAYHLWVRNNKDKKTIYMITNVIKSNDDVRRTLAMGLYHRFKRVSNDKEERVFEETFSELFLRNDPYEFEHFVAEIYQKLLGGTTYVTSRSNDYGVDIEHHVDGKLFYIQVKCEKENLSFDAIAKVHSNMIKHGADGGMVVNISDFSKNARHYAEGINIELVNGVELVDMWMKSLNIKTDEIKELSPVPI